MAKKVRLRKDDPAMVALREYWMCRIDDAPRGERGAVIADAMARLGISQSTLYEHLAAYKARGRLGLERKERRDAGRPRALTEPQEDAWIDFAKAAHRQHWDLSQRIAKFRTVWAASHSGEGLECSDYTLQRRWKAYLAANPQAAMTPKEITRTYRRQLRMGEEHSNRVWQWDQHTADFQVVDESTGELYRPIGLWLVDRCAGVMLGGRYFRRYDSDAVEEALIDGLYPSTDDACPYHGIPEIIHGDNGKQFTSKWAKRTLTTLGIRLSTGIACEPTGHGYIEGWHGIVGRFEKSVPRYLGRDALKAHKPLVYRLAEEGVETPEWSQPWTLDQVNSEFRRWVREQMQAPYKGGESRDARYWRTVTPERLKVPDPGELAWALMDRAECTVQGGIIRIHSLRYTAPYLAELNGQKVKVRYLRWNLRHLWVEQHGGLFCVAEPLEVFAYGSEASYRALRARNREFARWQRDAMAGAAVVRAGAELTGVPQAEAEQAAATLERVARQLKPHQREELLKAGPGAEVIDLNARRPVETKPLAPEPVARPSVTAEDLAGEVPARVERGNQAEFV